MLNQHPRTLEAREREQIEALYPTLRRFASAVRPPWEDANDLVQEALLRTIRAKGSLTSLDNPTAYLKRAIVNLAQDRQRSEVRRRSAWAKLERDETSIPDYTWDLEELRLVPPRTRAILYLHIIEGWPYADIAEMLGCSQVAARMAATRGRQRIATTLREEALDAPA